MRRFLLDFATVVSDGVLLAVVLGLVPMTWILRDGLGPNSVESNGLTAVWRWFQTFWVGPILIVLIVSSIVLHKAARRRDEVQGPSDGANAASPRRAPRSSR